MGKAVGLATGRGVGRFVGSGVAGKGARVDGWALVITSLAASFVG